MEVMSYIKCDMDSNSFAIRCKKGTFAKNTLVQVGDNQEVVILVNGKVKDVLPPGLHDLKLHGVNLKNFLTGFLAKKMMNDNTDVWFVNKLNRVSIFWRLKSFTLYDCQTNSHVPIYAEGRNILTLNDSKQFISALFVNRTYDDISVSDFRQLMMNKITSTIVTTINNYIIEKKIPVLKISENWKIISQFIEEKLIDLWTDCGMEMVRTEIGKIRILEEKDKLQSFGNEGINGSEGFRINNKEEKVVAEDTLVNEMRGGGGLMSSLNAINNYGKLFSSKHTGISVSNEENEIIYVYCHNCGTRYKSNQSFCPYCGKKYTPCPICGADNDPTAQRCYSCGHFISDDVKQICPICNSEVDNTAIFCPRCGTRLKDINDNVIEK